MRDFVDLDFPVIQTAKESPDSLPVTGYTEEQLSAYIMRQLGAPTWNVELTTQQIYDHVRDSLVKFSLWKPLLVWGAIPMVAGRKQYLQGVDVGQGIADVTFVENRLGVLNLDFGNPFTTMSIMTTGLGLDGVGDYASYLNWQKTWMRITSTMPMWQYDSYRKVLLLHNPIARYRAAILMYFNWPETKQLPAYGCQWVKEYALAASKYQLGNIWQKFSGSIPSPGSNLQLDQGMRAEALAKMTALEDQIRNSQELTPLSMDG